MLCLNLYAPKKKYDQVANRTTFLAGKWSPCESFTYIHTNVCKRKVFLSIKTGEAYVNLC